MKDWISVEAAGAKAKDARLHNSPNYHNLPREAKRPASDQDRHLHRQFWEAFLTPSRKTNSATTVCDGDHLIIEMSAEVSKRRRPLQPAARLPSHLVNLCTINNQRITISAWASQRTGSYLSRSDNGKQFTW